MSSAKILYLTKAGVIAALYAVVTIAFAPMSYGPIQVRISEALTVLPFLIPEAVPGLFLGCALANFFGEFGLIDVVFGSASTLIAAFLSSRMKTVILASIPPVVINMLVVGGYLSVITGMSFAYAALYVGIGEAVSCIALGVPLTLLLSKRFPKEQRGKK